MFAVFVMSLLIAAVFVGFLAWLNTEPYSAIFAFLFCGALLVFNAEKGPVSSSSKLDLARALIKLQVEKDQMPDDEWVKTVADMRLQLAKARGRLVLVQPHIETREEMLVDLCKDVHWLLNQ